MEALYIIALIKVVICSVILVLTSIEDWRTREISDAFWVVLGLSGGALTGIELLLDYSFTRVISLALSVIACLALGFILYYVGFFGGADAKCFWCLGIAVPYNPAQALKLEVLGPQNPIFSVSIFNNSVITAAALALGIMLFNAVKRMHGPLFSSGEEAKLWKRIMVLMLGYKMRISRLLEKKDFYFPLEEFSIDESGVKRRFRLLTRCIDEEAYAKIKELVDKGVISGQDEIWASPAIPLIVNIALGFFIALFYGDLVLTIVKELLGLPL